MIRLVIFFLVSMSEVLGIFDIEKFGAVANSDELKSQFENQKAIMEAIRAANNSQSERIVKILAKTFYSMPVRI